MKAYVIFSLISLTYVSLLSMFQPQATMDLVHVELNNNDAISSIRGIYGGVGLSIALSLIFLFKKNMHYALTYLVLFWGLYAVSRLVTILLDGPLGSFGSQWLLIELILCLIGLFLVFFQRKSISNATVRTS